MTRFLAFGDSVTEGVVSTFGPSFALLTTKPYPARLQAMLAARYTAQTFTVFNAGLSGEWAADGATRFPGVVRAQSPQVLILMEGDNDLDVLGEKGIRATATALNDIAREARFRGVKVFICTLPPQKSAGIRAESAALVPFYNQEVREVARGEGATVIDLYAAFGNDPTLIGSDGLHPTAAGYERIAQTVFNALKNAYEVRATATSASTTSASTTSASTTSASTTSASAQP